MSSLRRLALYVTSCCFAFLIGCSPASRMVRETAPADGISVGAQSDQESTIAVSVDRLIVRNGPGSWVRDAAWDEYLVRLEPRGGVPIRIVDVSLASEHLAEAAHPTAQLDALEKGTSKQVQVLLTAGVSIGFAYGAGAAVIASAVGGVSPVGIVAGATAAMVVMPVAAIAGGVYMHKKHKRQKADRVLMQEEIARRALALPLEVAPGSVREGSWFFPITPAPRQLQVRYVADGVEREVAIDLPTLAQLHIKPREKLQPKSNARSHHR